LQSFSQAVLASGIMISEALQRDAEDFTPPKPILLVEVFWEIKKPYLL